MEEKKRYEIHIYDDVCVDLYENGVLNNSVNDTYKLENLLNQQDKRIKELEQENQQLKQSQKHLAIEQLKKVEEILWNSQDIGNVIDNDKFLEKLNYLIKSSN